MHMVVLCLFCGVLGMMVGAVLHLMLTRSVHSVTKCTRCVNYHGRVCLDLPQCKDDDTE